MEQLNLNLIPAGAAPVCHVKQYDVGRTIRFNLFNGASVYTLDGTETVSVNVRKPDGNLVTESLDASHGTYVEVVTTEQMDAVSGLNICDITIEKGGNNIATLNFYMSVQVSPLENGVPSESDIENLRSQVAVIVANQYDSNNVFFDNTPTAGHGTGYAVTSAGVKTALNDKADITDLADKADQTALDAETAARVEADDIINARIDNIVALPEGSTQGDAELMDIRVGADGVTYATAGDAVRGQFSNVNDELDYMFDEVPINPTDVATSDLFTKYSDYNSNVFNSNEIRLQTLSDYDTYFLAVDQNCSLYFGGTLPDYVAICYGTAPYTKDPDHLYWYCQSAVRYRKSDNNLPSISTPLDVLAGSVIAITLKANTTVTLYGLETKFAFSDNAKEQIYNLTKTKKPLLIRDATPSGYVTDRLYIYIPTKIGFVKYDFVHYVKASINADTWNIYPVYAVDDDLTSRFALTTTGEFECALQIKDAPDFMGGIMHGSEQVSSIYFFADGKNINLSEVETLTSFEELRIVEVSDLYDPTDEVTLAAKHSKEYIFNADGLTINQGIQWVNNYQLMDSYMAMFPTIKSVLDYLRVNNKIDAYDLSNDQPYTASGTDKVFAWGDKILCDFDIPVWKINGDITGSGAFFVSDNGGYSYYKMYYRACGTGTVSAGDVWETSSFYNIQIGD